MNGDSAISPRDRYMHVASGAPSMRGKLSWAGWAVALLALYWWSAVGTKMNLANLFGGIHGIGDILGRMLPPDFSALPRLVGPAIETVQISIWGTTLGILIAIPVGLLAASNIAPHKSVYYLARLVLNFLRAVPEMVMALIFVAAVGLGPFPGVLAVAFHSVGMLGKFLAESIENVETEPIDALTATGAGKTQVFVFSVVPQILPSFVALCLFRWEMNFRSSTVLGIVGAGGLGFELISSMRLFRYPEMTLIILLILAVVTVVDGVSSLIRKRII